MVDPTPEQIRNAQIAFIEADARLMALIEDDGLIDNFTHLIDKNRIGIRRDKKRLKEVFETVRAKTTPTAEELAESFGFTELEPEAKSTYQKAKDLLKKGADKAKGLRKTKEEKAEKAEEKGFIENIKAHQKKAEGELKTLQKTDHNTDKKNIDKLLPKETFEAIKEYAQLLRGELTLRSEADRGDADANLMEALAETYEDALPAKIITELNKLKNTARALFEEINTYDRNKNIIINTKLTELLEEVEFVGLDDANIRERIYPVSNDVKDTINKIEKIDGLPQERSQRSQLVSQIAEEISKRMNKSFEMDLEQIAKGFEVLRGSVDAARRTDNPVALPTSFEKNLKELLEHETKLMQEILSFYEGEEEVQDAHSTDKMKTLIAQIKADKEYIEAHKGGLPHTQTPPVDTIGTVSDLAKQVLELKNKILPFLQEVRSIQDITLIPGAFAKVGALLADHARLNQRMLLFAQSGASADHHADLQLIEKELNQIKVMLDNLHDEITELKKKLEAEQQRVADAAAQAPPEASEDPKVKITLKDQEKAAEEAAKAAEKAKKKAEKIAQKEKDAAEKKIAEQVVEDEQTVEERQRELAKAFQDVLERAKQNEKAETKTHTRVDKLEWKIEKREKQYYDSLRHFDKLIDTILQQLGKMNENDDRLEKFIQEMASSTSSNEKSVTSQTILQAALQNHGALVKLNKEAHTLKKYDSSLQRIKNRIMPKARGLIKRIENRQMQAVMSDSFQQLKAKNDEVVGKGKELEKLLDKIRDAEKKLEDDCVQTANELNKRTDKTQPVDTKALAQKTMANVRIVKEAYQAFFQKIKEEKQIIHDILDIFRNINREINEEKAARNNKDASLPQTPTTKHEPTYNPGVGFEPSNAEKPGQKVQPLNVDKNGENIGPSPFENPRHFN